MKRKRNDIAQLNQSFKSKQFICVSTAILITVWQSRTVNENFLKSWNGKFRSTGPNGQRGPSLQQHHFDRKISSWAEAFYLFLGVDRKFRKVWHNGKQPTLQSLVKGAISGEEEKGMERLAKVFLPGVAIRYDNGYLKSVYYNSEYISLHQPEIVEEQANVMKTGTLHTR